MNMKIVEWLDQTITKLKQAGVDAPRTDALAMLEKATGLDRTYLLTHPEHTPTTAQGRTLCKFIERRMAREPLAYILGKKEFYGRKFIVSKDVLIPRPESEDIIEMTKNLDCKNFIDIGTGSGCLAISIKLEIPNSSVIATDTDDKALKIAQKNALELDADIQFIKSDLLKSIDPRHFYGACIVGNLPYVPENLVTSSEIKTEPKIALFSGKDGMDLYEEFWVEISELKNKPNYIITESLESQHPKMQNLAKKTDYELTKTSGLIQRFES